MRICWGAKKWVGYVIIRLNINCGSQKATEARTWVGGGQGGEESKVLSFCDIIFI